MIVFLFLGKISILEFCILVVLFLLGKFVESVAKN